MNTGRLRSYEPLLMTVHRMMDALMSAGLLLFLSHIYGMYRTPMYPAAAAVVFLLCLAIFNSAGIYRSWRGAPVWQECSRLFLALVVLYAGCLALAFTLKVTAIYSRRVLLTWMLLLPLILFIERAILRACLRAMRAKGWNVRRAIVAGRGQLAERVVGWLSENPWTGAKLVGFFDDKDTTNLCSIPYRGPLKDLPVYVKKNSIDQVYLALPVKAQAESEWLLRELADSTASVFFVPDVFLLDVFLGGYMIHLNDLALIGLWESPYSGINHIMKRLEDKVLAATTLLITAPVMLAIAGLVKVTSKGPVIFKQWRYGLDGKPILVYKFRTMVHNGNGDTFRQATKSDPRVTPLGRFLRKTSLDELPQFINVLQGRLSVVGPRPHPVILNEEFRKKVFGYMLRHKVRPGITGLAQVNGWRGETDTLEKMQKRIEYDMEYLRNWSLWLDMKILTRTVVTVVKGDNVY